MSGDIPGRNKNHKKTNGELTMINIQDIIPFMKKGWVAMERLDEWYWFDKKPWCNEECGVWEANAQSDWHGFCELNAFDIAPADDWTKSLIKVGKK
jgi:hypothetical protein